MESQGIILTKATECCLEVTREAGFLRYLTISWGQYRDN